MAHCNNIFAVEMKGNNEECFPIIEKILNEVLNNVCKKILIFSLDYDRCSNCKSKLTNSRMKFNDFYEKKAGRKEKYVENNKKTCELFDKHIFEIILQKLNQKINDSRIKRRLLKQTCLVLQTLGCARIRGRINSIDFSLTL